MPLTITIPANEDMWDAENNQFVSVKEQTLVLEHSLISISKWERITKIPFITSATEKKITPEQWLLYVKCMTINQVNEMAYGMLTEEMFKKIFDYINDPMTATTIQDRRPNKSTKKEVVTSEVIYYQMISYGIPIELEKWHLNNLMTLISVFSIKGGGEKMSRQEAAAYQRAVNEKRRKGRKR